MTKIFGRYGIIWEKKVNHFSIHIIKTITTMNSLSQLKQRDEVDTNMGKH